MENNKYWISKDVLISAIGTILHQELMVVNRGSDEKPDYIVGGVADCKRELQKLFMYIYDFGEKNNQNVLAKERLEAYNDGFIKGMKS